MFWNIRLTALHQLVAASGLHCASGAASPVKHRTPSVVVAASGFDLMVIWLSSDFGFNT